jgi:hypothetical protein
LLAAIRDKGEFDGQLTSYMTKLLKVIAPLGECLVVLDTVSDIAELNENLRLPPNTLFKKVLQPICDTFGATIVVNCHPSEAQIKNGKMTSGTTGWKNSVRNVCVLTVDETTKIRTLKHKYTNYEKVADLHLTEPTPCLSLAAAPAQDKTAGKFTFRRQQLTEQRRYLFDGAFTEPAFADMLVAPLGEGATSQQEADRKTAVELERKSLSNAHSTKAYYGVLCDQRVPVGGTKMQWRWFIVAGEPKEGEDY